MKGVTDMQTREIMTQDVKLIHRDTSLKEAAGKMKQFDIGMLPVVDEDKVVGILTDRDIIVRAIAEGKDPDKTRAGDAMSTDVITAYDDQDATEISELMKKNQVRRLVVLNHDNKITGVFSLGDLATALADMEKKGEVLESVSKPSKK
jgi:CBS domain-containing protein